MTESKHGLLLVLMQPPAALEEEFNAWYDTEHVPERAAVPGFQTALRYVNLSGYPRYMALYDLDSTAILHSTEYLAVSGPNFSPWTKRVTSRVQVIRIAAEQIYPGDAVTARSSRLLLVRIRAVSRTSGRGVVELSRKAFESLPETTALRVFADTNPGASDYYVILELTPAPAAPIDLLQLGPLGRHVDIVNMYSPYAVGA